MASILLMNLPNGIHAQIEHWLKNRQLTEADTPEYADFLHSLPDSLLAFQASQCVLVSLERSCPDSNKMQVIWNEVIRRTL